MDFLLQNGGPKATLIEAFNNKAILLCDGKRWEFSSLAEAKEFVKVSEMEISLSHLHGSSVRREMK